MAHSSKFSKPFVKFQDKAATRRTEVDGWKSFSLDGDAAAAHSQVSLYFVPPLGARLGTSFPTISFMPPGHVLRQQLVVLFSAR